MVAANAVNDAGLAMLLVSGIVMLSFVVSLWTR